MSYVIRKAPVNLLSYIIRRVFDEINKDYPSSNLLGPFWTDTFFGHADKYVDTFEQELDKEFLSLEQIDYMIEKSIEYKQEQTYLVLLNFKFKNYVAPAKQLEL